MQPPYRFTIQPRHAPRGDMAGDWAGLARGTGYEFWGLRKYLPGDSWSHIDWKARARSGELYVREFLRDSAYNLLLICDVSRSMHFGGKFGMARDLAVSLAHAALRSNNPCGLLLFADRLLAWHPPSAAPRQWHRIVAALQQAGEPDGRSTRMAPALKFAMRRLPSFLGVILSDFHADLEGLRGLTEAAERRFPAHEMVALHILETMEYQLPDLQEGLPALRDMESGRETVLDLSRREALNTLLHRNREGIVRTLASCGIDSAVLPVGAPDIQARVNALFARRLESLT